ncbi:MAG: TonB-dependent receptor [Chitinophagaceae bacterium]
MKLTALCRIDHRTPSFVQGKVLMNRAKLAIIAFAAVLLFSVPGMAGVLQAPSSITGKVLDETGKPIPGATVSLKTISKMAVTDKNGAFTLDKLSPGTYQLVISFIGYKAIEKQVEVSANQATTLTLVLEKDVKELDETVVIGYGSSRKKDLTGSVGQVNMKDFEKAPVKSFDDALAGRLAGVQVSGNDGQPGSVNNIVIRGAGSVTQDNSPLYVVDGFPLETAENNSINPADIESIDVLKDASATAIYGARGANGVIIITTKKGKSGPPVITYNGYVGMQQNPNRVAVMNSYDYVKLAMEIDPVNAAAAYLTNGKTVESYKNAPSLNLQDQLFRTAFMHNHDLAIRGGNDKTRYSISGNYQDQQGVIINSGFKRYQGRVTLDQTVNNRLKVGINVNYSYNMYYGAAISSSNYSASLSTLYGVWGWRPVTGDSSSLDDELYDPLLSATNTYSDYRVNPVIDIQNQLRENKTNSLMANAYAEYTLAKGLTLRVTGGITNNLTRANTFNNSKTSSGNPRNTNGVNGSIYNYTTSTWLNENTLTYKTTFNNAHHLTVLAGFSSQKSQTATTGIAATQVPNEQLGLDALDQGASQSITSLSSRWTLASLLGRINYDYKSKYLLTASFRADGSSKFSPGHRWGYFPSGSIAWRMSSEEFMKSISFISDAKLRISYGTTGNNRVSDFPYLSQLTFPIANGYSYNNQALSQGVVLSAYGNPDLKWETTAQTDIGYDVGFLKNRIQLTVDWYKKVTRDLLLNASLPYTTGLSSAYKNIGKMQNTGWEFTLNTINVQTKDFTWSSNFNISFNKNKVLALTENQEYLNSTVTFDTRYNGLFPYIALLNQPVAQLYGLTWDGVYQYSDFDKSPQGTYTLKSNITTNGVARANIQPGDIKYKDINGDLVVDAKDYTVIGRALPIHTGGFSNNFTYKNFDLNVFLQWSYGNQLINANRLVFEGSISNNPYLNQYATYANRWTAENPSNTYYRAKGGGNAYYSSRVVEDGSYLKLKTVSLGYNLPANLLKKNKIKGMRVYASAQNLYTWTNYSGPDPEVSVRNSTLTPGFDFAAYPHARTLTLGLNVTF